MIEDAAMAETTDSGTQTVLHETKPIKANKIASIESCEHVKVNNEIHDDRTFMKQMFVLAWLPNIARAYINLSCHFLLKLLCVYVVFVIGSTVYSDVRTTSLTTIRIEQSKIDRCYEDFHINNCHLTVVPALKDYCQEKDICMSSPP